MLYGAINNPYPNPDRLPGLMPLYQQPYPEGRLLTAGTTSIDRSAQGGIKNNPPHGITAMPLSALPGIKWTEEVWLNFWLRVKPVPEVHSRHIFFISVMPSMAAGGTTWLGLFYNIASGRFDGGRQLSGVYKGQAQATPASGWASGDLFKIGLGISPAYGMRIKGIVDGYGGAGVIDNTDGSAGAKETFGYASDALFILDEYIDTNGAFDHTTGHSGSTIQTVAIGNGSLITAQEGSGYQWYNTGLSVATAGKTMYQFDFRQGDLQAKRYN